MTTTAIGLQPPRILRTHSQKLLVQTGKLLQLRILELVDRLFFPHFDQALSRRRLDNPVQGAHQGIIELIGLVAQLGVGLLKKRPESIEEFYQRLHIHGFDSIDIRALHDDGKLAGRRRQR